MVSNIRSGAERWLVELRAARAVGLGLLLEDLEERLAGIGGFLVDQRLPRLGRRGDTIASAGGASVGATGRLRRARAAVARIRIRLGADLEVAGDLVLALERVAGDRVLRALREHLRLRRLDARDRQLAILFLVVVVRDHRSRRDARCGAAELGADIVAQRDERRRRA